MKNTGKSSNNWEKNILKSIDEKDVINLRKKLNEIQILNKNDFQSYNMNRMESAESME